MYFFVPRIDREIPIKKEKMPINQQGGAQDQHALAIIHCKMMIIVLVCMGASILEMKSERERENKGSKTYSYRRVRVGGCVLSRFRIKSRIPRCILRKLNVSNGERQSDRRRKNEREKNTNGRSAVVQL